MYYLDPNPDGYPVVLLLHGLGATGVSWSLQFQDLIQAGFRPVAPDLPGFGNSPYGGSGWHIPELVHELSELVWTLNGSSVYVVGLSLGGVLAQQFAHDYPEITSKLVLVSTFVKLRPNHWGGWLYFFRRILAITFLGVNCQARIVASRVFPGAGQGFLRDALVETISSADPRAYRRAMIALGKFDSGKLLSGIRAPTLVIGGSLDTTITPDRQHLIVDGIPNAEFLVIDGANHAVPIDHPDEFNRILLAFLKK